MNWENIVGVLFWATAIVFIGIIIHGIATDPTPWFWIYWIVVIGTLVIAVLLRNRVEWVGDMLAYYCAQMSTNNNWWNGTAFAIAIIFTINAMLAGMGEPVIPKSAKEVIQPLKEWAHTEQGQRWFDTWILHGSDYTESKDYKPAVTPLAKEESQYSSWIHSRLMIFWWIIALISYPITRRDEVAHAIRTGIKRAREKHDQRFSEDTSSSHEGGHGMLDFAKIALPFEILVEIVEILFRKFFEKIKPLAQKVMSGIKEI